MAAAATRSEQVTDPGRSQGDEANWFGDRKVDPSEKDDLVRGVFDRVARRYDLMNDLMSGGIHRVWKDRLTATVRPRGGELILDVAGGTGDISTRLLAAAERRGGQARAIICDVTPAMVAVGRDRAVDRGWSDSLSHVVGDAECLPVASRSVDICTIAFGLRNVTHIEAALAEAWRVLKPGGRFYCLEFSRVRNDMLRRAYDAYSHAVIPRMGAVVAQDRDAYQYLVESIRRFPRQEDLAGRMADAGFGRVRYENLTGGVAAIHVGWRL